MCTSPIPLKKSKNEKRELEEMEAKREDILTEKRKEKGMTGISEIMERKFGFLLN